MSELKESKSEADILLDKIKEIASQKVELTDGRQLTIEDLLFEVNKSLSDNLNQESFAGDSKFMMSIFNLLMMNPTNPLTRVLGILESIPAEKAFFVSLLGAFILGTKQPKFI